MYALEFDMKIVSKFKNIDASVLIVEPKEVFKKLLKELTLKKFNIIASEVDESVTKKSLNMHSIAFIVPTSFEQDANKFLKEKKSLILNALFSLWPFSPKEEEVDQNRIVMEEYFNFRFYPVLLKSVFSEKDLNKNPKSGGPNMGTDCSITMMKPNTSCEKWIKQLMNEGIMQPLDNMEQLHDVLQSTGRAFITPHFEDEKTKIAFIKENHVSLFWYLINSYCASSPLWLERKEITYEIFSEWFSHANYYPIVDLLSQHPY
jgi:hypothetical protein